LHFKVARVLRHVNEAGVEGPVSFCYFSGDWIGGASAEQGEFIASICPANIDESSGHRTV